MPEPLPTVTLTGRFVRLEPLAPEFAADLAAAAAFDRSTFGWTTVPDGVAGAHGYIDWLLGDHAAGLVLPFVQRRLDSGQIVGCTRFMEPKWPTGGNTPDEIEIGGTWLSATAQRTPINTEAKLLLFDHAFDTFGVQRVAICTDALNERSRIAIERLGATFEGVLRRHRPRAGTDPVELRDSAMYSVIADDWPDVRAGLEARLDR